MCLLIVSSMRCQKRRRPPLLLLLLFVCCGSGDAAWHSLSIAFLLLSLFLLLLFLLLLHGSVRRPRVPGSGGGQGRHAAGAVEPCVSFAAFVVSASRGGSAQPFSACRQGVVCVHAIVRVSRNSSWPHRCTRTCTSSVAWKSRLVRLPPSVFVPSVHPLTRCVVQTRSTRRAAFGASCTCTTAKKPLLSACRCVPHGPPSVPVIAFFTLLVGVSVCRCVWCRPSSGRPAQRRRHCDHVPLPRPAVHPWRQRGTDHGGAVRVPGP